MEKQFILVCEDSDIGILTGVYEAYERRLSHDITFLQVGNGDNLRLFSEYITVEPSSIKAEKVMHTVELRFGKETLRIIMEALGSADSVRADAVYKMIVFGLRGKYHGKLIDCLSCDAVVKVIALSTNVWHEYHHLYGFIRFEELKNGILYSVVHAKNRVMPFLGEHFANRFPNENFIIYDENHNICLVHSTGKEWFLADGSFLHKENIPEISDREARIQELFCYFCQTISIRERENFSLQKQMLPLRFRSDMIEFR